MVKYKHKLKMSEKTENTNILTDEESSTDTLTEVRCTLVSHMS